MTKAQQEAVEELKKKSLRDIQIETARKWAYRAWAARHFALSAPHDKKLDWVHAATEYEHEAIEHAALSGSRAVLDEVQTIVSQKGP